MTAAIAAGRRLFPRGYADFGYQLLIWFGFLAAYQVARGVADRDPTRAFANGWRVIGIEQSLTGLGELTLQGWTQSSRLLETLVSWTYWNSEFTVIGLALLWVYFRRNEAFTRFPPLASRRRKLAAALSGGERQMLVIARALLARPRVLLLDEPSLGLAPMVMAQVMDLVGRLSRENGITIILVEQNARVALAIADHGVVLNLGRVVASADAATLAADVALRHHYLGF